SPSLAEQATAAEALLKPHGISLLEAVRRQVEILDREKSSCLVAEAVRAFYTNGQPTWSERQAKAYRLCGDKLVRTFGRRNIATIRTEELQAHLEKTCGGAATFNHSLGLLKAIWNWSARAPRRWTTTEAIDCIVPKPSAGKEIGVLSAKEVRRLMESAESHFPDCVPAFAISLFTGMRQAELARLRAEDITEDGITVPAVSAKTKRRRFIQMPRPLAVWLAAYPITGQRVTPSNWIRKEKAVRAKAGWKVWTDLLDPPEPPKDAPEWPQNALRHTAASVALALGKPIETLIFEHGHSGGTVLLQRHYIGRMPKREAEAIWAIEPHGKTMEPDPSAGR
ncbi:MAG: tyrosine-type recombinase/integrase, partial [Verrucomicrobiae bacterium]|nr:tyrosine-type recombinase/integrase [Verrucomicrobiae bacterium]